MSPSVLMIILGLYTNTSIGMLFAAGIPAGLLIVVLFIAYVTIRAWLRPDLAPPVPVEERALWGERVVSLRAVILPIFLIVGVLGSIVSGIATPSEAAGVGAVGSLLCAALYRQLTWRNVLDSSYVTLRLSCMVMWIVFAASIFTALYSAVGAQELVREMLSLLPGGRWGVIIGMQLIWLVMGAFLDPIGIMIITTPPFFPIAASLGFDPVWFGILFVINMKMAFLTPPFGFNLFYIKGVAQGGDHARHLPLGVPVRRAAGAGAGDRHDLPGRRPVAAAPSAALGQGTDSGADGSPRRPGAVILRHA